MEGEETELNANVQKRDGGTILTHPPLTHHHQLVTVIINSTVSTYILALSFKYNLMQPSAIYPWQTVIYNTI